MRTVKDTKNVTIKVGKEFIIKDKYVSFEYIAKALKEIEEKENLPYKSYRYRFYNSWKGGKYNSSKFYGIQCVNIMSPMNSSEASLIIAFEQE